MQEKRKLIGQVRVDSGQLMAIDPCYINREWKSEGKKIGIKFRGQGEDETAFHLRTRDISVEELNSRYRIMIDDVNIIEEIRKEIEDYPQQIEMIALSSIITESTYDKVCDITSGKSQGGQSNYKMRHEGLGVAFSSGLGDGYYDVHDTYKDLEGLGEHITRVEITLVDEDEAG